MGLVLLILGGIVAIPAAIAGFLLATDDDALGRFHRTPRQPVRTASEGDVVKIVGKAFTEAPVVAPLSGREVVWYTLGIVDVQRTLDGTMIRERTTVRFSESSKAPFFVRDGSGEVARVVLDGEELFAPQVSSRQVGVAGLAPPSASVATLLARHGVSTKRADGSPAALQITERYVASGDEVVVIGPARRVARASPASGYREGASELVLGEKTGPRKRMFEVSNQPERALGAQDRLFERIAWSLIVAATAMLAIGAWLFWS